MKRFASLPAAVLLAAAGAFHGPHARAADARPNIVVIVADACRFALRTDRERYGYLFTGRCRSLASSAAGGSVRVVDACAASRPAGLRPSCHRLAPDTSEQR